VELQAVGFGSLNIDEMWEVPLDFLKEYALAPGSEAVRDIEWFEAFYPRLRVEGELKAVEPGGSAANTIAALRRMGHKTGFHGACGSKDSRDLKLLQLGAPENLRVMRVNAPSGRCLSLLSSEDDQRDRCLVIFPNANNMAGSEEPDIDFFKNSRWIHMTSFTSHDVLETQIQVASWARGDCHVSFDPGPIYAQRGLSALAPVLERTDLLFGDREELKAMTDNAQDPVKVLLDLGVGAIIEKRGPEGLIARLPGKEIQQPPGKVSAVMDRTGAGDVAAAGFLAGWLAGLGVEDCLWMSAQAAAKSIEGFGRSAYPDRDFYDRMIMNRVKEQIFD
jgi:ribokinase